MKYSEFPEMDLVPVEVVTLVVRRAARIAARGAYVKWMAGGHDFASPALIGSVMNAIVRVFSFFKEKKAIKNSSTIGKRMYQGSVHINMVIFCKTTSDKFALSMAPDGTIFFVSHKENL